MKASQDRIQRHLVTRELNSMPTRIDDPTMRTTGEEDDPLPLNPTHQEPLIQNLLIPLPHPSLALEPHPALQSRLVRRAPRDLPRHHEHVVQNRMRVATRGDLAARVGEGGEGRIRLVRDDVGRDHEAAEGGTVRVQIDEQGLRG